MNEKRFQELANKKNHTPKEKEELESLLEEKLQDHHRSKKLNMWGSPVAEA